MLQFASFDINLALELANLIDQAYDQFDLFSQEGNLDSWLPTNSKILHSSLTLNDSADSLNNVEYRLVTIFNALEVYFKNRSLDLAYLVSPFKLIEIPFGFVVTRNQSIYVVFRGTRTPLEWFDNGEIKQVDYLDNWGKTTFGFKKIYEQLSPAIIQALKDLQVEHPDYQVFVTGHSLGGALASLCVPDIIANTSYQKPVLYSFGSPRTGDTQFAQAFKNAKIECFRINNTEDIVPNVPFSTARLEVQSFGLASNNISGVLKYAIESLSNYEIFEHIGKAIYFTSQQGTIADNHNLKKTYREGLMTLGN